MVYLSEAHATDGWQMPANVRDGVLVANHQDLAARCEAARACSFGLKLSFPAVVDGTDDAVERAYTAWPDRLYLVDRDGRIAFKTAPGPFGFSTELLAAALTKVAP